MSVEFIRELSLQRQERRPIVQRAGVVAALVALGGGWAIHKGHILRGLQVQALSLVAVAGFKFWAADTAPNYKKKLKKDFPELPEEKEPYLPIVLGFGVVSALLVRKVTTGPLVCSLIAGLVLTSDRPWKKKRHWKEAKVGRLTDDLLTMDLVKLKVPNFDREMNLFFLQKLTVKNANWEAVRKLHSIEKVVVEDAAVFDHIDSLAWLGKPSNLQDLKIKKGWKTCPANDYARLRRMGIRVLVDGKEITKNYHEHDAVTLRRPIRTSWAI